VEVLARVRHVLPRPALPPAAEWRRNAVSGVVVGIIALPLSIALAVAVGVPPIAGLYTAVFAGGAASLCGGSRFNITGPTAALVPVLSGAVLAHGPAALPMVGLLAGVILFAMSLLGAGRLVRFIPHPVVIGFTAGIALSIAFGQLNTFLAVTGTDPRAEHFHEKLWDTLRHLQTVGATTPLMGLAALVLLFAWQRFVPRVPGPLVAVTGFTALTWWLGLDTPTLASRYGDLPRDLPSPSFAWFDAGLAFDLLPVAVAVAVLGSVESLLAAVVGDGMAATTDRTEPDRELFGQAVANLVSPVMGGIPATAAIARTAAGIRNGATSRLTGIFHALTVLLATLAFGGLAGHIPLTVLAAVLIVVAWNIAEADVLAALVRRAPREDLVVLVSTILVTLFFDLTYAIGLGMVVSMVLLIRRLSAAPAAAAMLADEGGAVVGVSPELGALIHSRPDIAFYNAGGFLSFHSAAQFEHELQASDHRPLILRTKDVRHIDTSGLLALREVIRHHRRHGGRVVLTAIQPEVREVLERFGILAELGDGNVFEHTACAIAAQPPGSAEC